MFVNKSDFVDKIGGVDGGTMNDTVDVLNDTVVVDTDSHVFDADGDDEHDSRDKIYKTF